MTTIENFDLSRLTNGMHFNYIETVLTKIATYETLLGRVNAQYLVLQKKKDAEDDVLKLSQKSLTTDEIVEADRKRDVLYMSYRKRVKASLDSPLDEEAAAAKEVNQSLKDYGIDPEMKLDDETGKLTNLITDHEGKLAEQVAALGLTQYITAMKEANELVKTLVAERADERAKQTVGALKAARAATDAAYKNLVQRVNALLVLEYDDSYQEFADYVNTEIKRYRTELAAGKTADGGGGDSGNE